MEDSGEGFKEGFCNEKDAEGEDPLKEMRLFYYE